MSEASNNLRHWAALTRMSGYNISADDFEAAADEIDRLREIEAEALFLVDRLSEFDLIDDAEDMIRNYIGHVEPSEYRLRNLLTDKRSKEE